MSRCGQGRPCSAYETCGTARYTGKVMRTTTDRLRHAISFELIGLVLVIPIVSWMFNMPAGDTGLIAVVSATIATTWNYIYNLVFDHGMVRFLGHVHKSIRVRIFHTLLFEAGLLVFLLPFIAWYLQVSIVQAFFVDFSFTIFYLVYTFVFNWGYDLVFPLPREAATVQAKADRTS